MVDDSPDAKSIRSDWKFCLPANSRNVYNITDEAVWALSSCKVGKK